MLRGLIGWVRGDGLFCGLHALGRSSRNPLFFWSAVGCIALISSPATRLRNSVREQRSCQKVYLQSSAVAEKFSFFLADGDSEMRILA